jgi:hypothetical protein
MADESTLDRVPASETRQVDAGLSISDVPGVVVTIGALEVWGHVLDDTYKGIESVPGPRLAQLEMMQEGSPRQKWVVPPGARVLRLEIWDVEEVVPGRIFTPG